MITSILARAAHQVLTQCITQQLPCTMVIAPCDWEPSLPGRLNGNITINLDNTDLSDSYVDEFGTIILTIGVDDVAHVASLDMYSVLSITESTSGAFISRNPPTSASMVTSAVEGSVEHSTTVLLVLNPHLATPLSEA